jgi:hypothetical protein
MLEHNICTMSSTLCPLQIIPASQHYISEVKKLKETLFIRILQISREFYIQPYSMNVCKFTYKIIPSNLLRKCTLRYFVLYKLIQETKSGSVYCIYCNC